MYTYLNRDSNEGWLKWFSAKHWVAPVPAGIKIPANIINRSAARYGAPFIVVRSQAPVKLGQILTDRLASGRPMYATILGEPPQDVDPTAMIQTLAHKGIWIDPSLDCIVPVPLLTRLAQLIVAKNGLVDHTFGIWDRLVTGAHPGVNWQGPVNQLGSLTAA